MKPEIKQLWLAALRSGTYQQGQGTLVSGNHKYCCLGVLCDVYQKQTGQGEWVDETVTSDYGVPVSRRFFRLDDIDAGRYDVLPKFVQEWAGLPHANPIAGPNTTHSLAEYNDDGESFEQIADRIETELLE